jgi:dolichol kinase
MAILAWRKTWRLCGIIFPLVYYFNNKSTALLVILPFLSLFIVLEVLRFFIFRLNERLFILFRYILKEKEKKSLFSTSWFLLSIFLSVILFRKDIAIAAMLFLIFGDIASSVIGIYFGRTKIRNYTLEGSLANFVTCLIIGIIINFTQISLPWTVIVTGALAAAIIELFPLLDDNFTITLFSGIMMSIVSKIVS